MSPSASSPGSRSAARCRRSSSTYSDRAAELGTGPEATESDPEATESDPEATESDPEATESLLLLGTGGDTALGNLPSGAGEPPRRSTDGDVSPILSTDFFGLSISSSVTGFPYSRLLAPSRGLTVVPGSVLWEDSGRLRVGSLVSLLTLNNRNLC